MEEICGIIELSSGSSCTLDADHRTLHCDRSTEGIEIHWSDEDHFVPIYTAYRRPVDAPVILR